MDNSIPPDPLGGFIDTMSEYIFSLRARLEDTRHYVNSRVRSLSPPLTLDMMISSPPPPPPPPLDMMISGESELTFSSDTIYNYLWNDDSDTIQQPNFSYISNLDLESSSSYLNLNDLNINDYSGCQNTVQDGLDRCLKYCYYLFPKCYEFDKEDLIQLWIAEGFIPSTIMELEDTAGTYFDALLSRSDFQFSRLHPSTGLPRYKLNPNIFYPNVGDEYCKIEDCDSVNNKLSVNTLHASMMLSDGTEPTNFITLNQAKKLGTLLVFKQLMTSSTEQVPRDLFLELPSFKVLDLRNTNITELPSSIGNLLQLRYLNLSRTHITSLPESLCSLYEMQTLRLKDCLELVDLPKGVRKLTKLRHLDLEVDTLLTAMLQGLGDLTELQTLPVFIVGKENGCHINELKHMLKLKGSLSIIRLENVSDVEEAKEAALNKKKHLEKLELQWTVSNNDIELLKNLQPHKTLKELQIVGYGGAEFPSWIGDPIFSNLVTITLYKCTKSELLPPLGKLPLLANLFIYEMQAVKAIGSQFYCRDSVTGFLDLGRLVFKNRVLRDNMYNAFPSLVSLRLSGMRNLEIWTGIEEGDFPLLCKLNISDCQKLTALPELSILKSLKELEINLCPSLQSLTNKGLEISLESLFITYCPLLKERFCNDQGEDWKKIAKIPNVWIDYKQVS